MGCAAPARTDTGARRTGRDGPTQQDRALTERTGRHADRRTGRDGTADHRALTGRTGTGAGTDPTGPETRDRNIAPDPTHMTGMRYNSLQFHGFLHIPRLPV